MFNPTIKKNNIHTDVPYTTHLLFLGLGKWLLIVIILSLAFYFYLFIFFVNFFSYPDDAGHVVIVFVAVVMMMLVILMVTSCNVWYRKESVITITLKLFGKQPTPFHATINARIEICEQNRKMNAPLSNNMKTDMSIYIYIYIYIYIEREREREREMYIVLRLSFGKLIDNHISVLHYFHIQKKITQT